MLIPKGLLTLSIMEAVSVSRHCYHKCQQLHFNWICLPIFQAVATYDLRFLDIFAGWPGRSHDARVFRMNPLFRTLPGRLRHRQVNRLSETYHILGDSAFPLSPQLLTPFRNWNTLNVVQRKYNRNLSSKRNVSSEWFINIFCHMLYYLIILWKMFQILISLY